MNLKDLNDVFESKYSLTESFKRLNEEDEFDDEVAEEEIPEGMKQVCLSICVNIPEEMAEEDICDFFINDFGFDAEPFEDCEIAKVECSVEDGAEDEEFAEEEIEEPEDFEESLDEGILDKLKSGINQARANLNTNAAEKRYASGNFSGAQQARTRQAQANDAVRRNQINDQNVRLQDRQKGYTQSASTRNQDIQNAQIENNEQIMAYLKDVKNDIMQLKTRADVEAARKEYFDAFIKKNGSNQKLVREFSNALNKLCTNFEQKLPEDQKMDMHEINWDDFSNI